MSSATFREKLPSAAAAIAVQLALAALLIFSISVVRHVVAERETFITLPPLAPPRQPVAPKTRGSERPAPVTPSNPTAPAQAPPWFYPQWELSGVAPGGVIALAPGAGTDCRPEKLGLLDRKDRGTCTRLYGTLLTPPPRGLELTPPRVANEDYWAAERAASRTLPKIPCVSMVSGTVGEGGFQKEEVGVGVDVLCALGQLIGGFPGIPLPSRDNLPSARPPIPHSSDAAFQAALAAYHARIASLYGRPVLASAAKRGGGDDKKNAAGGAGADPGGRGPNLPVAGPGR